jgi:sugar phosphate isomerase/epimerase
MEPRVFRPAAAVQETTMTLTRREWARLVVGGVAAAPIAAHVFAQSSHIAGVRIGAQSYSFRGLKTLDDTIAAYKSIGLSYCELWQNQVETGFPVPEGTPRREALRTWRLETPLDHFRSIRKRFEAAGVTLTAYNLSFRDDFTDGEIARGFEIAEALGVGVITASSSVSVAPRLVPHARRAKIKVAFHNHSRIAPNEFATPDDFATAMAAGPDVMAVNLDIGHFTAANFDPLEYLDEHHAQILSLHIKDRRRDQGSNVPFGEGDTPIVAVLQRLRDRRWDIPAQIEYEYKGADPVAEVRRCLDYCRKALEG